MTDLDIRPMRREDVAGVVHLQAAAFPEPFDPNLLWRAEHLVRHLEIFPEGQWVASLNGDVVASASTTLIDEASWQKHGSWDETVGGPMLGTFSPTGTTLYGLDISVDSGLRGRGVGRKLYEERFALVRRLDLIRYGTACRLPDFASAKVEGMSHSDYVSEVIQGRKTDRTLTPLLRYGLTCLGVIENYMEDAESGNGAALLEWRP